MRDVDLRFAASRWHHRRRLEPILRWDLNTSWDRCVWQLERRVVACHVLGRSEASKGEDAGGIHGSMSARTSRNTTRESWNLEQAAGTRSWRQYAPSIKQLSIMRTYPSLHRHKQHLMMIERLQSQSRKRLKKLGWSDRIPDAGFKLRRVSCDASFH